jgi:hypothetical protein
MAVANGGRQDWEVVGVVGDMRQASVTDPQTSDVFVSYRQSNGWIRGSIYFVVRTTGDPSAQIAALRTAVREQDPTLALDSIMTMEDRVATSLAKPRLYAMLLIGFAVAALAIAGVGLFGVLSYAVAQRARDRRQDRARGTVRRHRHAGAASGGGGDGGRHRRWHVGGVRADAIRFVLPVRHRPCGPRQLCVCGRSDFGCRRDRMRRAGATGRTN